MCTCHIFHIYLISVSLIDIPSNYESQLLLLSLLSKDPAERGHLLTHPKQQRLLLGSGQSMANPKQSPFPQGLSFYQAQIWKFLADQWVLNARQTLRKCLLILWDFVHNGHYHKLPKVTKWGVFETHPNACQQVTESHGLCWEWPLKILKSNPWLWVRIPFTRLHCSTTIICHH